MNFNKKFHASSTADDLLTQILFNQNKRGMMIYLRRVGNNLIFQIFFNVTFYRHLKYSFCISKT